MELINFRYRKKKGGISKDFHLLICYQLYPSVAIQQLEREQMKIIYKNSTKMKKKNKKTYPNQKTDGVGLESSAQQSSH
jgi:hypothetical protein